MPRPTGAERNKKIASRKRVNTTADYKHGRTRVIRGKTQYWNKNTNKWQSTKPGPLIRKVKVEKTKPETRQERIKREGLADWRVDSEAQKKLNIDKKRVKFDKPQPKTNKTTSNNRRKKLPGEFPGTREEFDKKYGTGRKKLPGEFPGTREEFDKKYGTGDTGKKKTAEKDLTIKKDKAQTKTSNQKKEKSKEQIAWEKKTKNSPARKSGKFSDEELWLRYKEHQDWKKRNNRLKIRK